MVYPYQLIFNHLLSLHKLTVTVQSFNTIWITDLIEILLYPYTPTANWIVTIKLVAIIDTSRLCDLWTIWVFFQPNWMFTNCVCYDMNIMNKIISILLIQTFSWIKSRRCEYTGWKWDKKLFCLFKSIGKNIR